MLFIGLTRLTMFGPHLAVSLPSAETALGVLCKKEEEKKRLPSIAVSLLSIFHIWSM